MAPALSPRTVYLDWSTLCNAFKGTEHLAGPRVEFQRLHEIVEALAATGRLCLSPSHISELLIWRPQQAALRMAKWLDELRPAWIRAFTPLIDEELRWWLNSELRLPQQSSYAPFVANLSSAFAHWTGPDTPHIPTIEGFVRYAHEHPSVPESREHALQCFQRLHADRTLVAGEHSQAEVGRCLRIKFQQLLVQRAQTLNLRHLNGAKVSAAELPALVGGVVDREESVPCNRLISAVIGDLAAGVTAQQSDSARFRDRYSSMGYDLQHLCGGAYCDVFTCDRRVDQAIGEFRERRGLGRQLSMAGRAGEEFVEALSRLISAT